ncbi:MAG: DUF4349 domain-containing protein [Verrucomicrobia bacterium]|nr:DUF4349 domain-containing protein [Verrucomicrobiota bacterium]
MDSKLLAMVVGAAVAAGCSSSGVYREKPTMLRDVSAGAPQVGRVILRSAWQTIETRDVRVAVTQVEAIARSAGGHVESSSVTDDHGANVALRIPSAGLDATMDRIAALGDETSRRVSARDVTEEVVDLQAVLANKTALRDRLRALLAQAKDVKDIVAVEEQLTRLQGEIDSMEGRLKSIRSQADLSALEVDLEPARILGPVGYVLKGAWWLVEKLFVIR